jgi:hypothetical protein
MLPDLLFAIGDWLFAPPAHPWPETHTRAQPLQSEARNAKNVRKSPIPGVSAPETTPTGGVF